MATQYDENGQPYDDGTDTQQNYNYTDPGPRIQGPDIPNPQTSEGNDTRQDTTPAPATQTAQPAPSPYAAIQGFDSSKLSNPDYVDAKYDGSVRNLSQALGSGISVSRGNLQPAVDYARANGFPNAQVVGDDKIDYGDGNGPIDVVQQNGSVWFQNGADRFGGGSGAAGSGGSGGSGSSGSGGSGGGNWDQLNSLLSSLLANQQGNSALEQQKYQDSLKFRQNILDTVNGIISRNSDTPTAQDPIIAGEVNAFRGEGERQARNSQEAAAERGYHDGTSSGALDSLVQQNSQAVGRNTGAYSAGLLERELNARRANLMGAAQLGAGIQSGDQANALQDRISTLQSAITSAGKQGDQAIDWATLLQKPQLAQIATAPSLLAANNQNQQFYDKFAYDQANNDQSSNILSQLLLQG